MTKNDSESQKVTWSEVEKLIKVLADKVSSLQREFSSIATISRGGLVPSRLLADHLGINTIVVDPKKISSDSIFVDDIYDSGTTFKKIINRVDHPSDLVYVTGEKNIQNSWYLPKKQTTTPTLFILGINLNTKD